MDYTQNSSGSSINKIFSYTLLVLVFFLPIIFFPSITVSLYSAKVVFLATLSALLLAVFLARTLSEGVIQFPKARLLIPMALFPVIALVSSLFSGTPLKSIVGLAFDFGTSGSFLMLTLLFFLIIFALREDLGTGLKMISAFLLSAGVVVLHLLARVFAGSLPEALVAKIPNFLVGGSIDTVILLGASVIAVLSVLNMREFNNKTRYALYALLVFSVLFLGAVNFLPVIVVVGLFALVYFVYTFSWVIGTSQNHELLDPVRARRASFPALFVLALSVIFVLSGGALGGYLSNLFKLNMVEVRPNLATTMQMVGFALKQNAVLGVGPNKFAELWDLHKPVAVNQTQFWASQFDFGSGLAPTLIATTGLLGLFAFLGFLALYAKVGFRAIFSLVNNSEWRYLSSTSFFLSLFLWVMMFVYAPNIVVVALAFIFTALFISSLAPQGVVSNFSVNIFKNPRANFASVFAIVIFLIASIAGGYFVWERAVATSVFQQGSQTLLAGDSAKSKTTFASAISLAPSDAYWRGFSESSLLELSQIIAGVSNPQNLSEADRASIQSAIGDTVESARQAINWNRENYQNWFALGRVYEILATNGVEGALENAKSAYLDAQKRAPTNPGLLLALGRLEAIAGHTLLAREKINQAIEMKQNYTDAYFALAQLEVASNNIPGAIRSVESATLVDPNNATLFFQLGLLKYNQKDYRGAVGAFERAVVLVPDYANARYFLGLSYDNLNRTTDAIVQFIAIQKTNPDNQEVTLILENLRAGRSPFANAKPPVDDTPEKREVPPLEDK